MEDHLTEVQSKLNRNGKLEVLLQLLSMDHWLRQPPEYQIHPKGTIVVLGQSEIKADDLLGIAKNLRISKDHFEMHLEYDDAVRFNHKRIQWSEFLVGPMGHSGAIKGEHSSMITVLESESGYPPVIRLGKNGLKITKSDFRSRLSELIERGKIA